MSEKQSKMSKCIYYYPTLRKGLHECVFGAKTLGDYDKFARPIKDGECENCEKYKSRYIEYPITVNKIECDDIEPWNVKPSLVKVRVCKDNKTYLGIYLGEFPHFASASYNEESKIVKFNTACNPCIYVPDLDKVVWGCESWWSRIKSEDELKDITDDDIDSVWYVRLLKDIGEEKE